MVRMPGLEPGTSSLSVTRSNHLSYTRNFVHRICTGKSITNTENCASKWYTTGMQSQKIRKKGKFGCINEDFIETDPIMTQELIIEQWKSYVASAEAISEQRQQFVNWFNGANGLIVAAFAGILKFVHVDGVSDSVLFLRFFPPLLGMVISVTTIFRIFIYRERKKDKYAQIYVLEHFLPFKIYTNEYRMRKRLKLTFLHINFSSGTRLELLIPFSFLGVEFIMLVWSLFTI